MEQLSEERRLFGTNGIRGVFNKDLTPEFALEIGESIGTFFEEGELVFGYDGRISSPILADIVTSGLISTGCSVVNIGMAPTPATQYLTKTWGYDGAVIVTASHNPPEYNGIKVSDSDGIEMPREKEIAIEKIYFGKEWRRVDYRGLGAKSTRAGALEEYRDAIKRHIDLNRTRKARLKVVVDPANGVGALVTPYLLREIGCQVYTINANLDGTFPARSPEPTVGNLLQLGQAVKAFEADFGVAHDGDADRAIFVDENGVPHWGDKSFAIIEKHFLSEHPGETIVTPISSSQAVEEIAEAHGGKVYWTRVGSINVSRAMQQIGAKLGGEENGGVFYGPHLAVRDGAVAAALIADILSRTKKKFSELLGDLPSYQIVKDKVSCPNAIKEQVLEKIVGSLGGLRVETIDGAKIWLSDNSWILIRPSGTEPIYRLFAEAKTLEEAAESVSKYKAAVKQFVEQFAG